MVVDHVEFGQEVNDGVESAHIDHGVFRILEGSDHDGVLDNSSIMSWRCMSSKRD